MEWYYAKDGKQEGPVSAAQLRQMAATGKLGPTDMVFKIGTKDWVEALTVSGLFPAVGARPAPADGGFAFSDSEKVGAGPARRKVSRDRAESDIDEEDVPRSRSSRRGDGSLSDLLMFRRMVAPWVIMILFWLGVTVATCYGLFITGGSLMMGTRFGVMPMLLGAVGGLISIPISILMIRLYCELMIVIFRMNETLTDIKNVLERQRNN